MKHHRIAILCLLGCALDFAVCQTSVRSQVESVLDSGPGREKSHEAVSKISDHPVPLLMSIAQSTEGSYVRRTRAIYLLATFKTEESERALSELAAHGSPKFRCPALQAFVELKSRDAVPLLISRLDDHAVCMHIALTDPARKQDVYVSDEAVRLLEQVAGQSFGQVSASGHRATKPWKNWWAKQKSSAKPGT
ncbi:MAG TPA: HEAT repeat domain-containing protein [Terriglobales bacterium]|nr:HEAT repeat domain-containing protein [Terriglobales bacterium]